VIRRLAAAAVLAVLAIALSADFLAADRPLVLRWQGTTYWLPNLVDHDDLAGLDGAGLRAAMTADDWALWPPVRHDPQAVRSAGRLEPLRAPSAAHLLGTDDRGRDVLARLIHGTRATVIVAAGAAALALALGLLLALAAVSARGRLDAGVVGACDVVSAVPALVVVVAAQGLFGAPSLAAVIVLVALPRAADTARIARASLVEALASDYCAAARALGATPARVLWRHALPHAKSQLAVATALTAATAVLAEAALGFLGFGVPPPAASWGELLRQAHENDLRWHLALPAGAAITTLAAALSVLGDRFLSAARR
jgi:ABC-type dipeptide/oligopeptide/nickel transport system permease subunit